ncbi:hypothetical protein TNCV_2627821 [Trichonephila clavipes]|nr:hypothetical protein TNCV_2627821 [Trichonephila clavipes]
MAFQASITAEVSACSEDGRFGWLRNLHSKGVLWDLDWGSEKASSVFEHPLRQTMSVLSSMCEWSSYPAGKEMGLPRNIALELGGQHCPECPLTSQSSCFQSQELTDPGQITRNSYTIMLTPPNLTVGTMQSVKKHSPGIRQTQTRPSDCQTVKRDSLLQRTVFPHVHSPITVSSTPLQSRLRILWSDVLVDTDIAVWGALSNAEIVALDHNNTESDEDESEELTPVTLVRS